MPPKIISSEPLLEENSGLSNPTFSEIDYNTASHAGLQSVPSLPSSFSQTVLPPPPAPKMSLLSNDTTIGPYPIRSAPTYAQDSDSQTASQSEQPQSATLTKKTPSVSFDRETFPTAKPRSSKAIDSLFNSSAASNPRKEKESVSISGQLKTKFLDKDLFLPDGEPMALPSGNKTAVQLWDSAIGAARGKLEGHTDWVLSVSFSPDGKLVASGSSDKTVRLWDLATGAAHSTLKGHASWVLSVSFSPDGKLVASGSSDQTVRLWDLATGATHSTLKGHTNSVLSVAFSPDGKLVASGSSDKTVRLWDLATGATHSTLKGHTGSVPSVAFSPDGKLVASGSGDQTVRLWDLATGAAHSTLKGHTNSVWSVAFSPDGKLVASGSDDKTIRLWEEKQ